MKIHTHFNTERSISGLSLVELMVALVVSSVLLLGVGTVYTASRQASQTNDEFASLQENARFALHQLAKNIRMAGYVGCRKLDNEGLVNLVEDPDNPGQQHPAYNIDVNTVAMGHKHTAAWNPPLPLTPANFVPGTSAISIRRASSCSQQLSNDMADTVSPVAVTNTVNCDFAVDQVVLVTDCSKSDIFMISGVANVGNTIELSHDTTKNLSSSLSQAYTTGGKSFVMSLFTTVYYIGTNGNGGTSLYEITNGGNPVELVPDVENMVLRYGVNTNSDDSVDSIRDANAIAINNWSSVLNVYVRLLFVSDPVGNNNRPYTFDNVTYDGQNGNPAPVDSRYRKEFVTTINLRNRTDRATILAPGP